MSMPSTDANALPTSAGERRWGLAAAIASVTVFGLSIGQGAPLLPLLLEARGTAVTLNGLNAGAAFVGVIVGPLLAPRCVRRVGIRNFLLVCVSIDIALTLALKAFDGEKMDAEQLAALGANASLIHVDWMIGSGEMNVDGVAADGSAEPLMRKGEWV